MREARIHVRHVRDLLKSVEPVDAYNGVDCASLSFLNTVCAGDIMEKKRARPDPVDCTPPDYVLPASQVQFPSVLQICPDPKSFGLKDPD